MTFLNFNTITLWKKYKLFEIHQTQIQTSILTLNMNIIFLSDLSITWDAQ